MYFNYHAKVKKLIKEGFLVEVKFFKSYNNISPAMVLYFSNEKPMPIREYRWKEYFPLIGEVDIIKNKKTEK